MEGTETTQKEACCFHGDIENLREELEFLRLFRLLNNTFREEMGRIIQDLDLTPSQLDVLIGIAQHRGGAVNQRDIEAELRLSNPTVTGILKRLEGKGFITRRVSPQDRRYKEVMLTDKCSQFSRQKGNRLHREAQEMLAKAFRGFTTEEFTTLNHMLRKLLGNFDGPGSRNEETGRDLEETV